MKNIIILFFLVISGFCLGQKTTKTRFELKGDKLYFIFAYHEAIKKYERVEKVDTLTADGLRKLADSYLKINEFVKSETAYAKLVSYKDASPTDFYNYADVLKTNGKYPESEKWMNVYFEKAPHEIRSINNHLLIDKIAKLKIDKGYFTVKDLPINTVDQEFAPCYYENKMVYSAPAIRFEGIVKKTYIHYNKPFLDLFIYDPQVVDTLNTKIEFKPKFNKKYHEGVVSFSSDLKRMYFTSNNYDGKDSLGSYNLEIFYTDFIDSNEWSEPKAFEHNNINYSVGHPYVTKDGKTLYFVSNMPGGHGGTDIYKCTLTKDNVWGTPENLGSHINTEGDELFPFFHDDKQILFFASNGLFGLGGLDIFAASFKNGVYGKVNNFGAPLNSQFDDFGIVINPEMNEGYFSSNRNTGKGNDDIYGLTILKELTPEEYVLEKQVEGIVKNTSGKPISDAKVEVYDEKNNLIKSFIAKKDGTFTFKAPENQLLKIYSSKDYYITDTTELSTESEELVISTSITLEVKEEIVFVDNVAFIKVQTIYFDVNSAQLREDTKDKLENVIRIMNENPNMSVELGSHTDCRGTEKYNMKLSQERAYNSAEYIKKHISNPGRIHGVGYGESQLVNNCPCEKKLISNCSEDEHQQNRRTEFKIITHVPTE